MTPDQPKPDTRRPRERWLEWAVDHWDEMVASLEEGLAATSGEWGYCSKCRVKTQILKPDLRARNDTVRLVMEMSGAKPKPDSDGAGGGFIVRRVMVTPEEFLDPGGKEEEVGGGETFETAA